MGDYRVDGQPRQLKAGMVLTVEPGLYIPVDDDSVPEAYRGIRIEDDVVVGRRAGSVNNDIPKQPDEIEALVGTATLNNSRTHCDGISASAQAGINIALIKY